MYEVCIPLDHLSTSVYQEDGTLVVSARVRYLSSGHGCIKHKTLVISARGVSIRTPSHTSLPMFSVTLENHIFSAFEHFFFHDSLHDYARFSAHLYHFGIGATIIHESSLSIPPKKIYIGKIACATPSKSALPSTSTSEV